MHIFSNAESYSVLLTWIVMPLGIYAVYRAFISSEFLAQPERTFAPQTEEVPPQPAPVAKEETVSQVVEEGALEPELPEADVEEVAAEAHEAEAPAAEVDASAPEAETETPVPEIEASAPEEEEGEPGETATDKALREMIAEDRVSELENSDASSFSENVAEDESEGRMDFTLTDEMRSEAESEDLKLGTDSRGPDSGPIEPVINSHDEDEGFVLSASSHGGSVEPPSYANEEVAEADLPEEESDGELSQDEIDMLLRKEG